MSEQIVAHGFSAGAKLGNCVAEIDVFQRLTAQTTRLRPEAP